MTPLGPVATALELDLSAWGPVSAVLAQTAREIASRIDSGPSDVTLLVRELRMLVKAMRESREPDGESEVDRFIRSISAEGLE